MLTSGADAEQGPTSGRALRRRSAARLFAFHARNVKRSGVGGARRGGVMDPPAPPANPHPATPTDPGIFGRALRRHVVVALFPPILIAVAFTEAVPSVREEALSGEFRFVLWGLLVVFMTTAVRFLIGNQFHLAHTDLLNHKVSSLWLVDFVVVVIESIILIALAGQVADAALSGPTVGVHMAQNTFVPILVVLYGVDVAWILLQGLIGTIWSSCKRKDWAWRWAALNGALLCAIFFLIYRPISNNQYTTSGVRALVILHVVAFVIDLVMIDRAGLRRVLESDESVTLIT